MSEAARAVARRKAARSSMVIEHELIQKPLPLAEAVAPNPLEELEREVSTR